MRPLRRKLLRARILVPLAAVLIAVLWSWHPWQRPIVIRERVNPRDGAVMVWVPAGKFRMGSDHRVLSRGYSHAFNDEHATIFKSDSREGVLLYIGSVA